LAEDPLSQQPPNPLQRAPFQASAGAPRSSASRRTRPCISLSFAGYFPAALPPLSSPRGIRHGSRPSARRRNARHRHPSHQKSNTFRTANRAQRKRRSHRRRWATRGPEHGPPPSGRKRLITPVARITVNELMDRTEGSLARRRVVLAIRAATEFPAGALPRREETAPPPSRRALRNFSAPLGAARFPLRMVALHRECGGGPPCGLRAIVFTSGQQDPHYARVLVGDRDRGDAT
jgi:hypothetical protein